FLIFTNPPVSIGDLFLKEELNAVQSCIASTLNSGNSCVYEHDSDSGEKHHYFQTTFSPVSYLGIQHVLLIIRDISAERQNREILEKSLERSKEIWESITDMFHFVNREWQIEYANSAWEKRFGFINKEEYLGKTVQELFPRFAGSALEKDYSKGLFEKEFSIHEAYFDSVGSWFSIRIFPSQNGISVYSRDVSDLRQLELKEQALETRLKDVWEKLIDGYVSLDKSSRVIYANQAFLSLFKLNERQALGALVPEALSKTGKKSEEFNSAVQSVLRNGAVERRICYFEDYQIWVNAAFFPTELGIDIYMQDISHAERLKNAMSDLSFMTSHELRHEYAKLHSVINLMSVSGEDMDYLLKEAHKSLIQINSLISVMNDKLTFNRDNTGKQGDKDYIEFDEVVLIDDDHVINYINARVLKLMFDHVKVKSFSAAEKALDYLKENDQYGSKLIFIDLNMPGFDGWDFLDSYRDLAVRSSVYVLTSSINPRDIERSMEYREVVKFLTKPLSVEMLEFEKIRPLAGKA
ncbi:MAG: PAS domain-containing protein, partial [Bacteroidetes bacterium]|nr:PAS domain-containing protein [Bacteroidota bacterium]